MKISLRCLLQLCHLPLLASGILLPPRNLSFMSQNFKHILTWEEPNNKSAIFYNVEYEINYRKFYPANNCSNIATRHCDLTKEFNEIFQLYRAQVWSFTSTERSDPSPPSSVFRPLDTMVGPPIVDVVAVGSGIMVSISLPDSYLWDATEQSFVSILTAYPSIDYEILLEPSTEVPISKEAMFVESFNMTIPSLFPSTTYCVKVFMYSENMQESIPSPKKCVITNGSPVEGNDNVYWIVAGVVLLIVLLLVLVILDQAGYISNKKNFTPKVLASFPDSRILHGPDKLASLIPLISTEIIHSLNNEHIHEDPARIMDSVPYIAHNRNAKNAEQPEAPNQDNGLTSNGPSTGECSAGPFLGFTKLVLSEGPSVEVMMPIGDSISTEQSTVIPWPERSTEAPSEDAFDGTRSLLSTLTNGCDDSLNLSLTHNRISIDFNSVLFGDSVDHCTSVPMVASPKDSHGHPNGDAVNISQFRLLPSVLNGDIPIIDNLNDENNEDGDTGSDLNHISNYIRR